MTCPTLNPRETGCQVSPHSGALTCFQLASEQEPTEEPSYHLELRLETILSGQPGLTMRSFCLWLLDLEGPIPTPLSPSSSLPKWPPPSQSHLTPCLDQEPFPHLPLKLQLEPMANTLQAMPGLAATTP